LSAGAVGASESPLVVTLAGLLFPGGAGDVSAVGVEEDVSAGASAGGSEATRFAVASDATRAGRTRADRTGADWTGEGWTDAMDDSIVWLELDVEPSTLRKDATC
jgi:hypothetical protein